MNPKETNLNRAARLQRVCRSLLDKLMSERALPEAEAREAEIGLEHEWGETACVSRAQIDWLNSVHAMLVEKYQEFYGVFMDPDTDPKEVSAFLNEHKRLADRFNGIEGEWKEMYGGPEPFVQELEFDGWRVDTTSSGRYRVSRDVCHENTKQGVVA